MSSKITVTDEDLQSVAGAGPKFFRKAGSPSFKYEDSSYDQSEYEDLIRGGIVPIVCVDAGGLSIEAQRAKILKHKCKDLF